MVIKDDLPDYGLGLISGPNSLISGCFLTQDPSPPIFNAPAVAVLTAASIPLLYILQAWAEVRSPGLMLALAFRPATLFEGGWWPGLLTSMALHAGWAHALMNAGGALAFGPPVARLMRGPRGAAGFVTFYIVCGMVAAAGYALVHPSSMDAVVGASGAVFGLTGAALRLLGRRDERMRALTDRRFLVPAALLMAVNTAVGLIGYAPGADGIAWEAHAAGFVFGAMSIGLWARLFGSGQPAFDSGDETRHGG